MGLRLRRALLSLSGIVFLLFVPITASHGQTADYSYDDLNRLIRVENPDGTIIGYTYDEVGNRVGQATPPAAATPVSASGSIATPTPTYTWDAVSGVTMYCLKVEDSTGIKIQQCYTPAEAGCPENTGSCSVSPGIALAAGAGRWWIATYNLGGYGPWSAPMEFSVDPPPAATLVSPAGSITTKQPTYTWNAIPRATRYYLSVNASDAVIIQQWYTAEEAGCPSGTGVCSVAPSTQLSAGFGQWWIQTYNAVGNGPLSAEMDFTIFPSQTDPYTKSLLHFDGADGGGTFKDETGKIWTSAGNAVTKTGLKKFGTASGYFPGGGAYLSTPDSTDFHFGTEDFTIDFWINTTSTSGCIMANFNRGNFYGSTSIDFWMNSSHIDWLPLYDGSHKITSTTKINDGNWHHIAAVRSGTNFTLYVDGVHQGAGITGWNPTINGGGNPLIIGRDSAGWGGWYWTGYIDELRISKGIARWTADFTPPSAELGQSPSNPNLGAATLVSPAGSIDTIRQTYTWNAVPGSNWYYLWVNQFYGTKVGAWYSAADAGCPNGTGTCSVTASADIEPGAAHWWVQTYNIDGNGPWSAGMDFNAPFSAYTKSLLHFDGNDGSTTFIDESGKVWTASSGAKLATAQKKFGSASAYFPGKPSYISTPGSVDFQFGTGNFTIDFWIRTAATSGFIISNLDSGNIYNSPTIMFGQNGSKIDWYPAYDGSHKITSKANINDGQWHHIAAVRSGTTFTLYVDGVHQGGEIVGWNPTINGTNQILLIGRDGAGARYWSGYIDELRISKGIARWTLDFTPPSTEYSAPPAITTASPPGGVYGTPSE